MGLCQSKQSTKEKPPASKSAARPTKPVTTNGQQSNEDATSPTSLQTRRQEQQGGAEQFLRSFLEGADSVLSESRFYNSPAEQQAVIFTFMNTCVEVTRVKFRVKTEGVIEIITRLARELKLKVLPKVLPEVKERYLEDGFSRLLNAWFLKNTGFAKTVDASSGQELLSSLGMISDKKTMFAFSDVLLTYMYSATTVSTLNVFPTFAKGHDTMTEEQLAKFLRETQRLDVTDSQVAEKYKYRFGGAVHRYNFNTYAGCLQTNSALDPARTSNVWQDMTQPLTRYFINTARIDCEEDLNRALTSSCRALILNLKKNDNNDICSGSCSLPSILDGIKERGFASNPYPIIICLSPQAQLSLDMQNEVAEKLTATLGPLLSKGLMFEGALISDPKFSPAAQRKKVLVLGYQSKLKPFIGCLVADMNKEGLGVRVTSVLDGTPAAKAGLDKDDWLTHINDEPIHDKQHLRERLSGYQLGEEFTLKRENLEELRVVVGGTVDTNDTSASTALSNILFLKYAQGKQLKPWETLVLTPESIARSGRTRKDLDDHFAFASAKNSSAIPVFADAAVRIGSQMIDAGSTQQARIWSNGRFVDNGHSGYLVKSDVGEEGNFSMTIDIIAGPKEIKGPALTKGVASVRGAGSARSERTKFTFQGCNEATTAVIDCEFAQNGGSFSFTAAFPPLLLRAGYRVLPLEQTGGPKDLGSQTLGAYCFIRRTM